MGKKNTISYKDHQGSSKTKTEIKLEATSGHPSLVSSTTPLGVCVGLGWRYVLIYTSAHEKNGGVDDK